MADSFDPYHKWLGISPKDQPPNHYRLLGIELFEGDPDVIESAADQRMAHVRTFQAGRNSADSQRLLNELSAAKLCLLDPRGKANYDAALRVKLQPASAPAAVQAPAIVAGVNQPLAHVPQPASQATPIIVSAGESGRAFQRSGRKRPIWQQPAVQAAGVVALIAVVAVVVMVRRMSPRARTDATAARKNTVARSHATDAQSKHHASSNSPANAKQTTPRPQSDKPATNNVAADQSASADRSPDKQDRAATEVALVADASHPPKTPGVTADRVVIWNQHNHDAKDRGTRECDLSLWRDGREVWRKDAIEIPWSGDADESVSVMLPPARFDRVRVDVTNWERASGGLAEIEVLRGDRNLALGCPAVASSCYDSRFPAARLTDGIHASATDAFWLLPDSSPGWAEVDLAFAEPRPSAGVWAEKLVVWNAHNAQANDRGALALKVRLLLGSDEVWREDDVAFAWQAGSDERVEIALPDKRFDRVRVEIPRWQANGAGLCEVQVIQNGINLARGCPVIASGFFDAAHVPSKVVDGIISSVATGLGYWLGRNNEAEWVEIDLSCNSREVGNAHRELGQYRALVEKDWPRGLPWLARGDAIELRALAADDLNLDERMRLDGSRAPAEAVAVGDRWWELSQRSSEPAKQELVTRALYRYAAATNSVPESDRARLAERVSQCLPLRGGTWLYLLPESETRQLWPDGNPRRAAIFAGSWYPWGLWMTPNSDETASATFHLAGKYHRFSGAAAISDTSRGQAATPLIFKVLGDERELWVSRPLQGMGESEPFDVDVSGVDQLRFAVECRGNHDWCHALWIDPVLDPASASPAIAKSDVDRSNEGAPSPPAQDASDGVIDLLAKVDVIGDRVQGDWKRDGAALISPKESGGPRLLLPATPNGDYEITIEAERLAGVESFVVGLVVGGRQVAMTLDGYDGETAGLAGLDGHDGATNESTRHGRRLPPGRPHTVVCTVRGSGLRVTCDGREALNWSGDVSRLSNHWGVPDNRRLFIGTWDSKFKYTRIAYQPLTEEPRGGAHRPRSGRLAVLGSQPRLAIPDDDAQKTARADLQKQFSAKSSAAKSPDAKRTLAEELIQKAAATTAPDAGMYVTLSQAVDLAESAGDLDLAWQAIGELAGNFEVDALPRRQQSLIEVGKAARSPRQYHELAEAACLLLADALAAEDAALVKKVAAQAQSFAKRAKDTALSKSLAARARDAGKLAAQLDAVSQARQTLKTAPDDASANFTIGHYRLCAAGDREHALPKLVKAADADWKKLANDDLNASRNDVDSRQQLSLADDWLSRAAGESWPGRHYLRMRAADWYRRALPSLAGTDRTRSVDRLKELLADDDGLPAWQLFEFHRAVRQDTYLRIEPGGHLRTCVEYDGPLDITFTARTDSLNVRLFAYGGDAVIWNWEVNPSELRVRGHDGSTVPFTAVPLQPNRWYTLRYRVAAQGTTITVDGLPVFSEPKAYQRFPRSPLGVNGAGPAVIDVKKFVVRAVQ